MGGEIVHYPLANGVDNVSEQSFFAKQVLAQCDKFCFLSIGIGTNIIKISMCEDHDIYTKIHSPRDHLFSIYPLN